MIPNQTSVPSLPCYGVALANSLGSFFSLGWLCVGCGFNSSNFVSKRIIGRLNISGPFSAKPIGPSRFVTSKAKSGNGNSVSSDENPKRPLRPRPHPPPPRRRANADNSQAAKGMADAITIIWPPSTKGAFCPRTNKAVLVAANLLWKSPALPMATSLKSRSAPIGAVIIANATDALAPVPTNRPSSPRRLRTSSFPKASSASPCGR